MTGNARLSLKAYRGDFKTLLAFSLSEQDKDRLAGFTIQCIPPGRKPYYLLNNLEFQSPNAHARVEDEPSKSSVNAPIHRFRWLHVPGSAHQGMSPVEGLYTYVVTPRYFDGSNRLLALDTALGNCVDVQVGGFEKEGLSLGFTRGYVQSQAFVHHFALTAALQPPKRELLFQTDAAAGTRARGRQHLDLCADV